MLEVGGVGMVRQAVLGAGSAAGRERLKIAGRASESGGSDGTVATVSAHTATMRSILEHLPERATAGTQLALAAGGRGPSTGSGPGSLVPSRGTPSALASQLSSLIMGDEPSEAARDTTGDWDAAAIVASGIEDPRWTKFATAPGGDSMSSRRSSSEGSDGSDDSYAAAADTSMRDATLSQARLRDMQAKYYSDATEEGARRAERDQPIALAAITAELGRADQARRMLLKVAEACRIAGLNQEQSPLYKASENDAERTQYKVVERLLYYASTINERDGEGGASTETADLLAAAISLREGAIRDMAAVGQSVGLLEGHVGQLELEFGQGEGENA
jgi:hypothetical protein